MKVSYGQLYKASSIKVRNVCGMEKYSKLAQSDPLGKVAVTCRKLKKIIVTRIKITLKTKLNYIVRPTLCHPITVQRGSHVAYSLAVIGLPTNLNPNIINNLHNLNNST